MQPPPTIFTIPPETPCILSACIAMDLLILDIPVVGFGFKQLVTYYRNVPGELHH
jgi:hypothetical protein